LVLRSMMLTATIQDGEIWLRDEAGQECHLGCRAI
jgi:uncharacterized protein YaeQ